MGLTQSTANINRNTNRNTKKDVWYAYESTRCVSDGTGAMRCVAVKTNSRKNTNKTNSRNNKNNNKTNSRNNKNTKNINNNVGLRRYGRRGIIGSL